MIWWSLPDLDRIRRIGTLLTDGLNLAGIARVLDLEAQNAQLQAEKEEHRWLSSTQPSHGDSRGPVVPATRHERCRPTDRTPKPQGPHTRSMPYTTGVTQDDNFQTTGIGPLSPQSSNGWYVTAIERERSV
jgi:hypothetical protein